MDTVNVGGAPLGMIFEVQEMPPDGSNCFSCKEPIFGKMFQYFLFCGNEDPMGTKFKLCETCFNKPNE